MVQAQFKNRIRLGNLYSVYGSLLTEKQRNCTELYFYDDMSLAEIAAGMKISRQAVSDILKRVEDTLEHYEALLGLMEKEASLQKTLEQVDNLLSKAKTSGSEKQILEARNLLAKLNGEGR